MVSLVGPFREFGLQGRKKRRRDFVSQETMQLPRWDQLWERDWFGLHTREHSKNIEIAIDFRCRIGISSLHDPWRREQGWVSPNILRLHGNCPDHICEPCRCCHGK